MWKGFIQFKASFANSLSEKQKLTGKTEEIQQELVTPWGSPVGATPGAPRTYSGNRELSE